MQVVAPSFEILDALDQQSLAVRIEACGRICYKSEDKITAASAVPFIRGIIKHGHNSVTEMGVLTLRIGCPDASLAAGFFRLLPRYLVVDEPAAGTLLITGSVRAFRELYMNHAEVELVRAITGFLAARHPLFYEDMVAAAALPAVAGVTVAKVPLAEVDTLPTPLLARHRHLAVKFIVNRAITHEIVRHRPCSYLQESQRYCRYDGDKFGNQVTFIKPLFYPEGSVEYRLWEKAMRETEALYLQLLATSSPQAARTVLPNSCRTELITYANLIEWLHIFRLRTSKPAEPTMREIMIPLAQEFKARFPAVFAGLEIEA
ncbi:MAG: thymidylate synthase complementing protein ThyX [Deltaproteobacteria bacterium RIFOXYD12_FULL_57_12]|nr:MAG: thymidylate synthase complementing protein ThyX [Deltaproteobacteria bacterium RIFOXYD12_FULL_57_12]